MGSASTDGRDGEEQMQLRPALAGAGDAQVALASETPHLSVSTSGPLSPTTPSVFPSASISDSMPTTPSNRTPSTTTDDFSSPAGTLVEEMELFRAAYIVTHGLDFTSGCQHARKPGAPNFLVQAVRSLRRQGGPMRTLAESRDAFLDVYMIVNYHNMLQGYHAAQMPDAPAAIVEAIRSLDREAERIRLWKARKISLR